MNNLDLRHARALMERLYAMSRPGGQSVVIVLHEINHASAWADHVVALKDGAVLEAGPAPQIMRPALLSQLYAQSARVGGRPFVQHYRVVGM